MMKFALTFLTLFASASLVLAQVPSVPGLSDAPKISPKCMNVLMKLLQDQELTKCLPIGQIVMGAVSGGPTDALTLIEEFKEVGEKICPAPMCSDSLMKEKVGEAASACSAELESLQMTSDQVIDLAVNGYHDLYELLCFKSSSGELCISETADNLEKYKDATPPPEVVCTPCNQAMFGSLKKLITLVEDSPIGKTINLDAPGILREDELKAMCGDNFISGNVPGNVQGPASPSNSSDSSSSSSTNDGAGNSTSENDGTTSNNGHGNSGSHSANKSSNKNNTSTDSETDSAHILQVMRSEYFIFGAIAMFAALL